MSKVAATLEIFWKALVSGKPWRDTRLEKEPLCLRFCSRFCPLWSKQLIRGIERKIVTTCTGRETRVITIICEAGVSFSAMTERWRCQSPKIPSWLATCCFPIIIVAILGPNQSIRVTHYNVLNFSPAFLQDRTSINARIANILSANPTRIST